MTLNYIIEPSIYAFDLTDEGMKDILIFAEYKRTEYVSNTPFPHIVIEGLFSDRLLQEVIEDIRRVQHLIKKNFYGSVKNFATYAPWFMGSTVRRFLLDLNSAKFCHFLEVLTGISGLVPDPYFEGAGIHEIRADGFLKMHTDFNWNEKLELDRRLNMFIYLNSV